MIKVITKEQEATNTFQGLLYVENGTRSYWLDGNTLATRQVNSIPRYLLSGMLWGNSACCFSMSRRPMFNFEYLLGEESQKNCVLSLETAKAICRHHVLQGSATPEMRKFLDLIGQADFA